MKFNLALPSEVTRARAYFEELVEKKKLVEVKRIARQRTLQQNKYLHVLISAFGAHFGYRDVEAKQMYKRINRDIYLYKKPAVGQPGKFVVFVRSSADLTTEEMAKSIDRFREYSDEAGYPLPLATDEDWLRSLENTIEQAKHYL